MLPNAAPKIFFLLFWLTFNSKITKQEHFKSIVDFATRISHLKSSVPVQVGMQSCKDLRHMFYDLCFSGFSDRCHFRDVMCTRQLTVGPGI